jgi:hypothetical protein
MHDTQTISAPSGRAGLTFERRRADLYLALASHRRGEEGFGRCWWC